MKKVFPIVLIILAGFCSWTEIMVKRLADYPIANGVAGAISGVIENRLVVAGGCFFPEKKPWDGGKKFWDNRIYMLDNPEGEWKAMGKLPVALSYGMTICDGERLICFGGEVNGTLTQEVFSLKLKNNKIEFQQLPSLPYAISRAGIAVIGKRVYLICGKTHNGATNQVWSAELPYAGDWKREADLPVAGRTSCSVTVFDGKILLFGGRSGNALAEFKVHTDAWEYFPQKSWWCQLLTESEGKAAQSTPIISTPTGLILLGSGGSDELSLHQRIENARRAKYLRESGDELKAAALIDENKKLMKFDRGHSGLITRFNIKEKRWEALGKLPEHNGAVCSKAVSWNNGWVVVSGEVRPGIRTSRVLFMKEAKQVKKEETVK